MKSHYLLGNEAIAHGCLEASVEFVAGYPGTPSSEIVDTLRVYSERWYHAEWSVNEKVALEEALAASWCGLTSLVTMKHVGLNVAADPLMTSAYTGVRGGFVILCADDPFAHSSQNEQDTRRYAAFAKLPCLDPGSVQEAHDLIKDAFQLSEELSLPVIVRPTTRICHSKSDVTLGTVSPSTRTGEFNRDPTQFVVIPAHTRVLHKKLNEKLKMIPELLVKRGYNHYNLKASGEKKRAVISGGISTPYVREVIGDELSHAIITAYPIDEAWLSGFIAEHDEIFVVEELEPVIEEVVRQVAPSTTVVYGKKTGHVPYEGEFTAARVSSFLQSAGFEAKQFPSSTPVLALPNRPPILCAGCAHRAAMFSIKAVFKDAIYPSDIGCYTLGIQLGTVDTTICMGAAITVASGIALSGEKRDVVCTIGDGTFLHTGIQGLLNAVHNGANIIVVILDNRVTAMTGHQPNPLTGVTAVGEKSPRVSLEEICRGCGASFVETISPNDMVQFREALKEAKSRSGVRVIIAKQACVISEKRDRIKRHNYVVSKNICNGCKACVRFGCPAIEITSEGFCTITELCSGCGLCMQICPIAAIQREAQE
jgi:indolepyruvate ferredoxin oxidoreductase alpha subunit